MPQLVNVPTDHRIRTNSDASSQPSCNRAAMIVLAERKRQDRRDVSMALSEAWEGEDACTVRERDANMRADQAEAAKQWFPWIVLTAILLAGAAGGATGYEIGKATH